MPEPERGRGLDHDVSACHRDPRGGRAPRDGPRRAPPPAAARPRTARRRPPPCRARPASCAGRVCSRCRISPIGVSGTGTCARSAIGIHRPCPGAMRARFGQQRERLFDRERVAAGSRGDGGVHSRLRGAEQVADECGRLIGRQGSEADDGEPIHLSCGREDDQQRRRLRRGDDVGEEPREPGTRTVHVVDLDQRRPCRRRRPRSVAAAPIGAGRFRRPRRGRGSRAGVARLGPRRAARRRLGQPCRDRVGRAEGLDARQRLHELGQRPSRSAEVGGRAGDREVPQVADRAGELVDESASSDAGFADDTRRQAALRSSTARSNRARRSANGRSRPTRGASQRAVGCSAGAGVGSGSATTVGADSGTCA